MAAEFQVSVEGRSFPFRQTMGAALLFKKTTGKEAAAVAEGNLSDIVAWLWCCVKSACRRDGVDFPYTLDDFADRLEVDDVNEWLAAFTAATATEGTPEGQKKI